MKRRFAALAGIVAIQSASVVAQPDRTLNDEEMKSVERGIDRVQETLDNGSPLDRIGAGTTTSSFQFETSQDEARASLAINIGIDKFKPERVQPDSDIIRLSSLELALDASAPIAGDNGVSRLFGGGSLVSGSTIRLALQRTVSYQNVSQQTVLAVRQDQDECVYIQARDWAEENGNSAAELMFRKEYQELREDGIPGVTGPDGKRAPAEAQWIIRNLNKENQPSLTAPKGLADRLQSECRSDGLRIAREYGGRSDAFLKQIFANRPQTFMGLDASIGEQSFESLDRDAFETSTVSRTSWEVGGYYGLIGPKLDWSVRARAVYGVGFDAPDEAQVCRMPEMSTDLECLTGPDGLPIRNETGLAQLEFRRLFDISEDRTIGIAPQVTYDIDEDEFDIDVPIYLSTNDKGQLSGGIRAGYSTRDDDFAISLFFGVPFSINF